MEVPNFDTTPKEEESNKASSPDRLDGNPYSVTHQTQI